MDVGAQRWLDSTSTDLDVERAPGWIRSLAARVSALDGDSTDHSAVATALREAVEETAIEPSGVTPVAVFPRLHIRTTSVDVTAVLAHWRPRCRSSPTAARRQPCAASP